MGPTRTPLKSYYEGVHQGGELHARPLTQAMGVQAGMQCMPTCVVAHLVVGWYQGQVAHPQSMTWVLKLPESARDVYYKEGPNVLKERAQERMIWCLQVSTATSQSYLLARSVIDFHGDLREPACLEEC